MAKANKVPENPKVLFIYPAYENLGVEMLFATCKRAGIGTDLLFDPSLFDDDFISVPALASLFSTRKTLLKKIEDDPPDIVCFSIVTDRFIWAKEFATAIKSRLDVPIIAGGIHVTSAPEQVLEASCFDFGFRGEADLLFPAFVQSLAARSPDLSTPNLVFRNGENVVMNPLAPLVSDLDTLPFADKEIFRTNSFYDPADMYTIMGSRGCPFSCTFCNNSLVKKLYAGQKHLRFRSVENVIEELVIAKERYNPKVVNFLDEVFASRPSWLSRFATEYKQKVGIPFIACTHPAVESEKRIEQLAMAGCKKVDMGVQTISDRLKKEILDRPESVEQVAGAIGWYAKHRIALFAENIIGLPTETEEDQRAMVDFYIRNPPAAIKVFWLSYYPGTIIEKIGKELGLIDETYHDSQKSISTGGHNRDKRTRRIYILLQLLSVLPRSWIEKILTNQWYRYFPTLFVERFAYLAGRVLNRLDPIAEVLMHRYIKHYRIHLRRALAARFRIRSK